MHPWLLQSPPISAYGTIIVAGFIAAWIWARRRGRAAGVDASRVDLLMPALLASGLFGAWLLGKWTDALTDDAADSAVLIGSLLVSTAAGIGYALLNRIPLGLLGDICAAPLALGIAIGRIGCFCAGCCFGKISHGTTWLTAVRFPKGSFAFLQQVHAGQLSADSAASLPVYPTQLYESALCLLLALSLAIGLPRWFGAARRKRVTGEQFLALGLGYALIRFNLEFLRADNPPIGGLTFSQWGSLLIAALATITWLLRRHTHRSCIFGAALFLFRHEFGIVTRSFGA